MSMYTGQIDWTWRRKGYQWYANAYDDIALMRPAIDTIKKGDLITIAKKDGETSEHVVFRLENAKRYGEKMAMDVLVYGSEDAAEMHEKAVEYIAKSEKTKKANTAVKHLERASRTLGKAKAAMERDKFLGIRAKRGLKAKIAKTENELRSLI